MSSIGIVSIELPETKVNFFWEVKTQVVDGFTLEHFLWLIEFRSQKSLEVIVKNEVLKLSKLHGHELLLDLSVDVIGFSIFEVTLHVNLLSELGTDQQNELFMGVGVNQELLVTELQQV